MEMFTGHPLPSHAAMKPLHSLASGLLRIYRPMGRK